MEKVQISPKARNQVRQFTIDVIRAKGSSNDLVALALFTRYHKTEIPEIASRYLASLNGDCPKTKKRIASAVGEFSKISLYVERTLLSNGHSERCSFDFLPQNPVSGLPRVALF